MGAGVDPQLLDRLHIQLRPAEQELSELITDGWCRSSFILVVLVNQTCLCVVAHTSVRPSSAAARLPSAAARLFMFPTLKWCFCSLLTKILNYLLKERETQ